MFGNCLFSSLAQRAVTLNPLGPHHFTWPPARWDWPVFYMSLPAFDVTLLTLSNLISRWWVSYCDFNFHFLIIFNTFSDVTHLFTAYLCWFLRQSLSIQPRLVSYLSLLSARGPACVSLMKSFFVSFSHILIGLILLENLETLCKALTAGFLQTAC